MFKVFKLKTKNKIIFVLSVILIISIVYSILVPISVFQSNAESGIAVPIIMYHSVCENQSGDYIVTTQTFKDDMMYLLKNGYTTIFVSDLVKYVYDDVPLPKKPIIITFDDGFLNNATNVLPIIIELNVKIVVSIIGNYSELYSSKNDRNEYYAHLTWNDINQMLESELVEIGNHTYNMHKLEQRRGCAKKAGESKAEYQNAISFDINKTQELLILNCNFTPECFAYPYGFLSEDSLEVLKSLGFRSALTCREKVNYITKDSDELFALGRFNRFGKYTTNEFMKKIAE